MNETPDLGNTGKALPDADLAVLAQRMEDVRVELTAPKLGEAAAGNGDIGKLAAELVQANEQLVLSALQAHSEAATAQRELDKVAQSADIDVLTGLPNRTLLLHRFAQALANAKRRGSRMAVLFLDLNGFKQINDRLGHLVGDEALKVAARCLAASIREADTASRYGGDEFLILLPEIWQASDAALIAGKINAALAAVEPAGSAVPSLTVSIGISIYPDDGVDATTLIGLADAAMYRAKRHAAGRFAFHGSAPEGEVPMPVAGRLSTPDPAWTEREHRFADLREANEKLLVAALDAQALQAAAEKSKRSQAEFLIAVARALRDPLAPIGSAVARIARVRPEELPRIQAIIERQMTRLNRLVSDLHDVSRVSTGKLSLNLEVLDVNDLIDQLAETCRPMMDAQHQRFSVHRPEQSMAVNGDPVRLLQVLGNLLDNASRHTPDGGTIDLSVVVLGDTVVVTVSDSGIGIDAKALPTLFEPFARGSDSIGFYGGGTGIGLTVVRELVNAHGGSVAATSSGTGRGSQFAVTLPLART